MPLNGDGIDLWIVPVALLIGAFGTIIGAGGGFLLVPVLLIRYAGMTPEIATSISLAAVLFNAISGTFAYGLKKRIDWRSGLLFAAAGVPGAALGATIIRFVPLAVFHWVFGVLMIVGAVYLASRRQVDTGTGDLESDRPFRPKRLGLGVVMSAGIGVLSSLLGVGGGIVHVPVMVSVLGYPVRVATATSTLVVLVMAATGVAVHAANGIYASHLHPTLELAVALAIGAQLGAAVSDRIHASWIIRALSAALGLVGIRLLVA